MNQGYCYIDGKRRLRSVPRIGYAFRKKSQAIEVGEFDACSNFEKLAEVPVPKRLLKKKLLYIRKENPKKHPKTPFSFITYYHTNPAKTVQRLNALKYVERMLDKNGIVVEAYGGSGELTKNLYAKTFKKAILIDKDKKALEQAEQNLSGVMDIKTVASDNVSYFNNLSDEDKEQLSNASVVDFDAYGCPAEAVWAFFDNVKLKKPALVNITDGFHTGLAFAQDGEAVIKEKYRVDVPYSCKREDIIPINDAMMFKIAEKHGYKITPINAARNQGNTLYLSYLLTPK